jgi:hypothetical protein
MLGIALRLLVAGAAAATAPRSVNKKELMRLDNPRKSYLRKTMMC